MGVVESLNTGPRYCTAVIAAAWALGMRRVEKEKVAGVAVGEEVRRVNARALSSPVVARMKSLSGRWTAVRLLMLFWWIGVRLDHSIVVAGVVRVRCALRWSWPLILVMPFCSKAAVKGQNVMWPSVPAVHKRNSCPRYMVEAWVGQDVPYVPSSRSSNLSCNLAGSNQ